MVTASPTTVFSRDEVAANNTADSLHVVIDSKVYDLTEFADAHPGGAHVLLQVAGKDATSEFFQMHRHEVLLRYGKLCIGTVTGETPQVIVPQAGDLCPVPYSEPQVYLEFLFYFHESAVADSDYSGWSPNFLALTTKRAIGS